MHMLLIPSIFFYFLVPSTNGDYHYIYGVLTIILVMMPLILSALIERSWECLNHIPFVQLNKHWKFLQSRALIEKENQEREVLEQKIVPKLIDFNLDHDKLSHSFICSQKS